MLVSHACVGGSAIAGLARLDSAGVVGNAVGCVRHILHRHAQVFGGVLATGKVVFRRDLLALLLKDLTLPSSVWSRLTWSWVGFFALMAIANWYVAFHFSTDAWVNFKVWGGIGLFLLFALAQGIVLARYVSEPTP